VLALPADVTGLSTPEEFARELGRFSLQGNADVRVRGLRGSIEPADPTADASDIDSARVTLALAHTETADRERHEALASGLALLFPGEVRVEAVDDDSVTVRAHGHALTLLGLLREAPGSIPLDQVQPAHEITRTLASGAMSHGALVAAAHEAVAHGTNMVGGMSNSGEGGEHLTRYGTIRGSRIKQFASGRFGIWTGYLADPMLEEIEIKIGQGAKPGEGGQLPAPKVTVEIAAARGGTPGIELISPPPHHDTYSIEDLAQLIHDAKAARVRVIVKLVSSEGIGTIAVGVAKAGADVINVAGNTGGTGAAAVTSLKYAGRSAEIGVAEVHQALVANGLRQKVVLRCSGAHQTGSDVITSALLGGDSFEFGTTALMMLGCVMAKNCNIKCPAGLTTNPEVFEGDARALAQYLLNIAHHVRRILATLGLRSLEEARGRSDLLQLLEHPASVGDLDVRAMLEQVPEKHVSDPVYLEKDFEVDDALIAQVREALVDRRETSVTIADIELRNRNKTVGGQLAIDVERLLNHDLAADVLADLPAVETDVRGRSSLRPHSVKIRTHGSAGQSFGAFTGDGVDLVHTGTANDGVGKSQSGGSITVLSPGGGSARPGGNVLIGNFALFGAMGGRTFVAGEAGDRFAVRNSGASAVVEGVGDFACEYMTNGAVLNLGTAGRGLGNGMSGGFFYQYDPSRTIRHQVSADSVMALPLVDHPYHEKAAKQLLQWHLEATGSQLAIRLLVDWERTREDLFVGMPIALLRYQDADQILAAPTRKELLDEFATSIARDRLRAFKLDYRDQRMVIGGRAPSAAEGGSGEMFSLLASYAILSIAQDLALERVPGAVGSRLGKGDPRVQEAARKLVLTEDFAVMQRVVKLLRHALEELEADELATLIATQRLAEYERSLGMRNVLSMDAPGTYGWIAFQKAKNAGRIDPARFDRIIATSALDDLLRGAPSAAAPAVAAIAGATGAAALQTTTTNEVTGA
jgi:glutamate synthase (NADPH/NADH) large chain